MAIKRKQTNKSKSRNRNSFQGATLPASEGSGINIKALHAVGIDPRHLNGQRLPNDPRRQRPQRRELPANFNRIFMEALPVFHTAIQAQAETIIPEIPKDKLGPILLVLERVLPNHPEHNAEGGLDTEALMHDLYAAYVSVMDPVETDSEEAATAFQVEVEKKLGALQFAALRETMVFIKEVQTKLNLKDDPAIAEASEFVSDLEQVSEEKIAAVMAEQRPGGVSEEAVNDEPPPKIEEVLGIPAEQLVQPTA